MARVAATKAVRETLPFVGRSLPLSESGLQAAMDVLGVGQAEIWTVLSVETHGCGFMADRRPVMLFERHVFHRRTAGAFDGAYPSISSPKAGGYLGGAKEYERLGEAMR